jgi:S-adenosylmethionine-diacylgycerolhomoserine-N-methlytransferase
MGTQILNQPTQPEIIQNYYRLHARFYEQTRWSFLFGRKKILQKLQLQTLNHLHLMEIGCGTGYNLVQLAETYPNMKLTGVDVSKEMLMVAEEKTEKHNDRIKLYRFPYESKKSPMGIPVPDILLFSYCLTMINPGWELAIDRAAESLLPDGRIAIVDFHSTKFSWFAKWMGFNHVRMDGHLIPYLENRFDTISYKKISVYGGLWSYFIFIGKLKKHKPENGK